MSQEAFPQAADSLKPGRQYSLRSLLVTMVTASMLLAYVRLFGSEGMWLTLLTVGAGLLGGGFLGWLAGRMVECLTWSLVGGVLALCCVLSADMHVTLFQKIFWIMVGVVTGAYAGFLKVGDWRSRAAFTVILWLQFGLIYVIGNLGPLLASMFIGDAGLSLLDALLALPVIGGLMVLVEIVGRLQQKHHTALDMWAAGLIFAVIAGNYGAIVVWNLLYA